MDALADELEIRVSQEALTERLVLTSRQYGVEPQQLMAYMQQNNQLPTMVADVRRGQAIAAAVEAATVTDTDGNVIDTSEVFGRHSPEADDAEALAEAEEVDKSSSEADDAEAEGTGANGETDADDVVGVPLLDEPE
jgi:trigger factor